MHELSIALNILEIAEEESEQRGNTPVEAIHVKLGAMSGVVKDALVSAFELAAEQSAFPNCRLIIEEIPAVVYCLQCDAERPVEPLQWFCCGTCGTAAADLIRGRELQVSALELAQ